MFLDFQKAFDKVPHARLLSKIKEHGISGHVLFWIGEWLNKTQQRVVLMDVCQTGYMSLVGYSRGPFWDPCCSSFLLMT